MARWLHTEDQTLADQMKTWEQRRTVDMNKIYGGVAGILLIVAIVVVGVQVNKSNHALAKQAEVAELSAAGCANCDSHGTAGHESAQNGDSVRYMGKIDADGKAVGSSLMAAYKAKELYTCPMHPEVITDHPNADCPICGMNLAKLSDKQISSLQDSKPKGCPMDPIVVSGNHSTEDCSICGMNLMDPSKSHGVGNQG